MLNLIIAMLLAMGSIMSADDYQNATPEQQQEYQEIIIEVNDGV